jgi:Domain of unknown function (DUF4115)
VAGRHRKTRPPRRSERSHHGRHRKPVPRSHTVVPTVTVVAVFAVGGVAFGHAVAHGQAPHAAVAAPGTGPVEPTVAPTVIAPLSPTHPATPKPKPRPAPHHVTSAALSVTDVHGACYIQVTRHGTVLVRRILHRGDQVQFRHHGLDVVLGNAGAVRVAIAGHHGHLAGRSGQVRRFRVR